MYISLTTSRSNGFKRWSDGHRPSNDDDSPGGATPVAVAEPAREREPAFDEHDAVPVPPHRPWIVPGMGGSL